MCLARTLIVGDRLPHQTTGFLHQLPGPFLHLLLLYRIAFATGGLREDAKDKGIVAILRQELRFL